jgi:hypothetical protein
MGGGHQRSTGERGDLKRARVLAVDQIAGAAQMGEVGEQALLGVRGND